MSQSHSNAAPDAAKSSTAAHAPAPALQRAPAHDSAPAFSYGERAAGSVGGGSPQASPARFGALLGGMAEAPTARAGVVRQLQRDYGNGYVGAVVQRKCECGGTCDDCRGKDLQRKGEGALSSVPDGAARAMRGSGGGSPLPPEVLSEMEPLFVEDFGGVRVHEDGGAGEAARELSAQAFTTGQDIFFGAGRYRPDTPEGRRLLAHELTHVVQQGHGEVSTEQHKPALGEPGDAFEREADAVARRVADGHAISPGDISPLAGARVQRQIDPRARWGAAGAAGRQLGSLFEGINLRKFAEKLLCSRASGQLEAAALDEEYELMGVPRFEPGSKLVAYLTCAGAAGAPVKVRFGDLAAGTITVRRIGEDKYSADLQAIRMQHPELGADETGRHLALTVGIGADNAIYGEMGVVKESIHPTISAPSSEVKFDTEALLRNVFGKTYVPEETQVDYGLTSVLKDGILQVNLPFILSRGGAYELVGGFNLINERVVWIASLVSEVRGLKPISREVRRDREGILPERAQVGTEWEGQGDDNGRGFSGSLNLTFGDGVFDVRGTVKYANKRLSTEAELTLLVTDEESALAAARTHSPVALPEPQAGAPAPSKRLALTGWGSCRFAVAKGLPNNLTINGEVSVVLHPHGYVVGRGTIRVPQAVELLKEYRWPDEGWNTLVNWLPFEPYRISVLWAASLTVGLRLLLEWQARVGPLMLYDIQADGTFSTEKGAPSLFDISGRLNMPAEASARVTFSIEASAKLFHIVELASASANFSVTGTARAYLDMRPTIGRRLTDTGEAKYFIRGEMEMAGQLSLKPELTLKFSAGIPPVLRKTVVFEGDTYNYADVGMAGHVDYTFGAGQAPQFSLGRARFDRGKFGATSFLRDVLREEDRSEESGSSGEFKEGGTRVRTIASDRPGFTPTIQEDLPRGELEADFSMRGRPHRLLLETGEPGRPALVKMASDPEPLSDKVGRARDTLQARLAMPFLPDEEERRLEQRVADLDDIERADARVEAVATHMGVEPQGLHHTAATGLGELAEQVHTYGERHGVDDMTAGPPATPLGPPPVTPPPPLAPPAPTGGSRNDPIPMFWYKPPNEYRSPILLEDRRGDWFLRLGQRKLFEIPDMSVLRGRGAERGGPDLERMAPNGTIEVGVEPQYIPRDDGTTIWRRVRSARLGPAQRAFAALVNIHAPQRYTMRHLDEDADHVKDLQFEGPDDFTNLWPLSAAINQSNRRFEAQLVTYRDDNGVERTVPLNDPDTLHRWFRIVGFNLF